jgi:hypothetical protein
MSSYTDPKPPPSEDFAREAELKESGFLRELFTFLRQNRKWWLLPAIIVLLLVGVLGVLGGTALAPFIYTLF